VSGLINRVSCVHFYSMLGSRSLRLPSCRRDLCLRNGTILRRVEMVEYLHSVLDPSNPVAVVGLISAILLTARQIT
jgi:hypothetical protein